MWTFYWLSPEWVWWVMPNVNLTSKILVSECLVLLLIFKILLKTLSTCKVCAEFYEKEWALTNFEGKIESLLTFPFIWTFERMKFWSNSYAPRDIVKNYTKILLNFTQFTIICPAKVTEAHKKSGPLLGYHLGFSIHFLIN